MEASKAMIVLIQWLGIPITGYAMFINIDTWKGNILFILGVINLLLLAYYRIKKSNQAIREKEIDLEEKRMKLDFEKKSEVKNDKYLYSIKIA